MESSEIISFIVGAVVSFFIGRHFNHQKKRTRSKTRKLEQKIEVLKEYTSATGYKLIIRDSLYTFSIVAGVILSFLGFTVGVDFVFPETEMSKLFDGYIAGCLFGCGYILIEHGVTLGKTYQPEAHITKLEDKIQKLRKELEEM